MRHEVFQTVRFENGAVVHVGDIVALVLNTPDNTSIVGRVSNVFNTEFTIDYSSKYNSHVKGVAYGMVSSIEVIESRKLPPL